MSLKIGLTITGRPQADVDAQGYVKQAIEISHAARDNGFDVLAIGQHFLSAPYTYCQPVPLLGRLIPETGAMRLATGVLLLPLLQPVEVAEQLATLDVMSGGRLTVGLGLGYRDDEFTSFGIEKSQRLGRQVEALDVMRQVWAGGELDHLGRYYQVTGVGGSIRPLGSMPIWVAAMADKSFRRVVDSGLIPYIGPVPRRDAVAGWGAVLHEERGQGAALPVRRELFVSDDGRSWDDALDYIGKRYETYASWGLDGASGDEPTPQQALAQFAVVGSPGEVTQSLKEYEAAGVTDVIFRVIWPNLPHERVLEMIDLMGRRVIPEFV